MDKLNHFMFRQNAIPKHSYNLRKKNINRFTLSIEKNNGSNNKTINITKKKKISSITNKVGNIWDKLNKKCRESDSWVSASNIKNYLLNDPILDWLNIKKCKGSHVENKLHILMEMGNKFESEVIQELYKLYPNKIVTILDDFKNLSPESMNLTRNAIKNGIQIICQAPLYNHINRTFGVADLLIRSDYVNLIFKKGILCDDIMYHKANELDGNYHYVVIDIKWTTMQLCANGRTIRNNGRFPAYKGQLAIYNAALGQLQGFTPNEAYVLSKSWSLISTTNSEKGYSCFELLGVIDYSGFDNEFISRTMDAILWIRDVRTNGDKWNIDTPSRSELYPNMCNKFDVPHHSKKKEIAEKLGEHTQIWMVGVKNRNIAHNKNIFSWRDKKCTANTLGISGSKIGPIVDNIIKINRDNHGNIIPLKIKDNRNDWHHLTPVDFYVDFESANGCFNNTTIDIYNSKTINNLLFMIGVGFIENGNWNYVVFTADSLNFQDEMKIIDDFTKFISTKASVNPNIMPKLYHWGHAERSMLNAANDRHHKRWKHWITSIIWLDFCQVFIDEPIVIKGAKKFNLKEIAKAMFNNGMIKSSWSNNGPIDGLDAMIESIEYYNFIEKYNLADHNTKKTLYLEYKTHTEKQYGKLSII